MARQTSTPVGKPLKINRPTFVSRIVSKSASSCRSFSAPCSSGRDLWPFNIARAAFESRTGRPNCGGPGRTSHLDHLWCFHRPTVCEWLQTQFVRNKITGCTAIVIASLPIGDGLAVKFASPVVQSTASKSLETDPRRAAPTPCFASHD